MRHYDLPCVCGGQGAVRGGGDDLEGGAEGVKSPRGELRGASGELQQTGQLFLSEAGHHGPEPLHHLWKHEKFRTSDTFITVLPAAGDAMPMTYFLSEVPRSSDNHSVGLEVLNVYITGATH